MKTLKPNSKLLAVVLAVFASLFLAATSWGEKPAKAGAKVYKLGIVPADFETELEKYFDIVNGINAQCDRLNSLIADFCCPTFDIGCDVRYVCEEVEIEKTDMMEEIPHLYQRETGSPYYPVNHGLVVTGMIEFMQGLELYGKFYGGLVVGYTRHMIRVDDQETPIAKNKIDPKNRSFYMLGSIQSGLSEREGRMMTLNYYASKYGLMASTTPTMDTALAQGIAEYRSSIFSFNKKIFTGTGSRDLFKMVDNGTLEPNIAGCQALAEREPTYYRNLLGNR